MRVVMRSKVLRALRKSRTKVTSLIEVSRVGKRALSIVSSILEKIRVVLRVEGEMYKFREYFRIGAEVVVVVVVG